MLHFIKTHHFKLDVFKIKDQEVLRADHNHDTDNGRLCLDHKGGGQPRFY